MKTFSEFIHEASEVSIGRSRVDDGVTFQTDNYSVAFTDDGRMVDKYGPQRHKVELKPFSPDKQFLKNAATAINKEQARLRAIKDDGYRDMLTIYHAIRKMSGKNPFGSPWG